MINKLNTKKKKKGFTLIELVIVLAVLAIIALIAIPNFTKVRNDSLAKADARTMEQIEKITLMAIANEDIIVEKWKTGKLFIKGDEEIHDEENIKYGVGKDKKSYESMIKEVEKPQVNGKTAYEVIITDDGKVTVDYKEKDSNSGTGSGGNNTEDGDNTKGGNDTQE